MPETEEPGPREPLTKLSGLESTRSVTSPMTAKSLMWTSPEEFCWSMKREVRTTECQCPAPRSVTFWTPEREEVSRYSPGGIHTTPPGAAAMASRKAWVESPRPLGSAPLSVTETEPAGRAAGPAACSKSATSTVTGTSVAWKATVSPAWRSRPSSIRALA